MEHFLGGQRSDRTRPFWGGDHKRKRKQAISFFGQSTRFFGYDLVVLVFVCLFLFEWMEGMEDYSHSVVEIHPGWILEGDSEGIGNVRFCTLDMVADVWGRR